MTDIKFGFHHGRIHEEHPPHIFAPTVESMGFDSVWLAEGLVNELPMLDIMMAMSAFVHHTRRLTVGGGVVLLPLRNPAILAKLLPWTEFRAGGSFLVSELGVRPIPIRPNLNNVTLNHSGVSPMVALNVSQQQINQIRRFPSIPQTPDSLITLDMMNTS